MAFEVRFTHYRTWVFGTAVPACDPGRKTKARNSPTTTRLDKVTCPRCLERMEHKTTIVEPTIGAVDRLRN